MQTSYNTCHTLSSFRQNSQSPFGSLINLIPKLKFDTEKFSLKAEETKADSSRLCYCHIIILTPQKYDSYIYSGDEQAQLPREARVLQWFAQRFQWAAPTSPAEGGTCQTRAQSVSLLDSHPRCASSHGYRALLWCRKASPWSYWIIADKSIWRDVHLGESTAQWNAMLLPSLQLWVSEYCLDPTLPRHSLQNPVQQRVHFALGCNATSPEHSHPGHPFSFSFFPPWI